LTEAINRVADEKLPGKLAGIVKLHAGIAVGSAFIPVPGADMAAAAGNIWTMYVRINKELGLPFSENLMKSLAAGVVTNLGAAAAFSIVGGSVLKFIPGLGSLGGGAIMATTVYAVTIASGVVYMNVVARLLRAKAATEVSASDLKEAADRLASDKATIQDILKKAKKDYKQSER
jgi:uncharacterized protein (DUF697 family)